MLFKAIIKIDKNVMIKEAKTAIKNVSKLVYDVKSNSRSMFGGLKNAAPKVPNSLPSVNISQGSKTSINKGALSKLPDSGDNVGNMLRGRLKLELVLRVTT